MIFVGNQTHSHEKYIQPTKQFDNFLPKIRVICLNCGNIIWNWCVDHFLFSNFSRVLYNFTDAIFLLPVLKSNDKLQVINNWKYQNTYKVNEYYWTVANKNFTQKLLTITEICRKFDTYNHYCTHCQISYSNITNVF